MSSNVSVAVIGATGHTGCELIRLLHFHPQVQIAVATSHSHVGKDWAEVAPSLKNYYRGTLSAYRLDTLVDKGVRLAFLCLPNNEAARMAEDLLAKNIKVIDLSADFRFRQLTTYEQWYGKHASPHLLSQAVYGLPELYRATIANAKLLGNPGCYVTAATLALKPLVEADLLEADSIIIDAASGVSGAGKAHKDSSMAINVQDNFSAYGVLSHRHQPEIENNLDVPVVFTPHLLPVNRGILATCYARTRQTLSEATLLTIFESAYGTEPFIDFRPAPFSPCLQDVVGTNRCAISFRYSPERRQLIVLSALDNLIKGAAGQAVQNMNIMAGFAEETGLNF